MADPAQIHRCAHWIKTLTLTERLLLASLIQEDEPGTAGVVAKLLDNPPDREGGATVELPADYWETAE